MITTQKYKIPALRFPEFSGEWEENNIGDFTIKVGSGSTPRGGSKVYLTSGVPFIRSQNVINNQLEFKNVTYISLEINKRMKGSIVKPNDVLLNITGASIGRSCVVPDDFSVGNVNQHVCIIRLNKEKSPRFLQSFLSSYKGQKSILRTQVGGGREGLNFQGVRSLKLFSPTLQEQQEIAFFLSSVDSRIEQFGKKKALLEQYKKGIMQKIFSQKIRFKDEQGNDYPDWEDKRLGKLVKITTGKLDANAMVEGGAYRFYTCARQFYQIDKYAFDTDALLISGNGANVGYIHHYHGKFNAYQRTYVLDNFSESISYVKCYLDYFLGRRIDIEKKDGNTPYIVMSTLSDMKIKIPTNEEQLKIAKFLSAIDQKIELISTELGLAKTFKKGLLQQMFI